MNLTLESEVQKFRVVYRNRLDGTLRVLIAGLDKATADSVMGKFGNPREKFHYMGPETRIEADPGDLADGAVISETPPAPAGSGRGAPSSRPSPGR